MPIGYIWLPDASRHMALELYIPTQMVLECKLHEQYAGRVDAKL